MFITLFILFVSRIFNKILGENVSRETITCGEQMYAAIVSRETNVNIHDNIRIYKRKLL